MKAIKLTTGEWLGVTVPEGYIWKIWGDGKTLSGLQKSIGSISNKKYIDLPEGSYSLPFPCVVAEMDEEQAAQVAEGSTESFGYMDYLNNQSSHFYPDSSLLSLCKANGWDPKTTILVKVNTTP